MSQCAFAGPSRDHRPRLLPREVGGRGCRDHWHPRSDSEDAHVLCAQEIGGSLERGWSRKRLAMMTTSKQAPEREEIESLLPWHAAGTLSRSDAERVERALASDQELARRFELVREELSETIHLNESLGAPSSRAMERLFARI